MPTKLTPQVFALLAGLVEQRCGLHYVLADLPLIDDRVASRALEIGFDSLLDYYYFLRYDAAGDRELDALIEALVVHESYFFREVDQVRTLVDLILAPAVAAGERLRIWCAACAHGEEPLTLAMLLAERGLLESVELTASDISTKALARAGRGEYGGRALRALPSGVMGRWLEPRGDRVIAHPDLRRAIRWKQLNLTDRDAIAALGSFDAILCRNVLIYFGDETARRVVSLLGAALKPGGHLLVGASESLLRFGTSFRCEERYGAFFYRKVE